MPSNHLNSIGHITLAHVAIRLRRRGLSPAAIGLGLGADAAAVRAWLQMASCPGGLGADDEADGAVDPAAVALGLELLGLPAGD